MDIFIENFHVVADVQKTLMLDCVLLFACILELAMTFCFIFFCYSQKTSLT